MNTNTPGGDGPPACDGPSPESTFIFTTTDPARLRATITEELATAAEALRDAVEFARTGRQDPDMCAHEARRAIATIGWAGDLFTQMGGRIVDPDDLRAHAG